MRGLAFLVDLSRDRNVSRNGGAFDGSHAVASGFDLPDAGSDSLGVL
jgi:hypothetical protein